MNIKDVAARAGVSVGTVSNVLNRPSAVRPVTRARVDAAIVELDFVPNASARQLVAGQSRTIAYVVLDAVESVLHRRRRGVEEVTGAQGFSAVHLQLRPDAAREDRISSG